MLSFVVGFSDITPFVVSLLQGDLGIGDRQIVQAIVIASASNNLLKLAYTYLLGTRRDGQPRRPRPARPRRPVAALRGRRAVGFRYLAVAGRCQTTFMFCGPRVLISGWRSRASSAGLFPTSIATRYVSRVTFSIFA